MSHLKLTNQSALWFHSFKTSENEFSEIFSVKFFRISNSEVSSFYKLCTKVNKDLGKKRFGEYFGKQEVRWFSWRQYTGSIIPVILCHRPIFFCDDIKTYKTLTWNQFWPFYDKFNKNAFRGIFWRSKWTWLNWSLSNNDQNEVDFWVEYFYDLNIESWTGFPFDPWKAVSCDSGCELTHFDLIGRDSRFKLSVVRNTVFQIGYFKYLSLLKEVCARTLFNESLFELDSRVCLIAWAVKFIDQRENIIF